MVFALVLLMGQFGRGDFDIHSYARLTCVGWSMLVSRIHGAVQVFRVKDAHLKP